MGTPKSKAQYSIDYARTHLKRIPLDVPITDYEAIKTHAQAQGESVNGFIKRAIGETMERDKADSGGSGGPVE